MSGGVQPALLTFAIPEQRPASVADRERLDRLLALTVASIYRQTDPDFRVLIAAAHTPNLPGFDSRLEIVSVPGFIPHSRVEGDLEAGSRRSALASRFADLGGGYLMFVDHDDFVSPQLVAHVRKTRHPAGYAADDGYVLDVRANVVAPYPIPGVATVPLHEFCGTSTILRLAPEDAVDGGTQGHRLFERAYVEGHHLTVDRMRDAGRPLASLPFPAAVYTHSGDNLSRVTADEEGHAWFQKFDAAVRRNALRDDAAVRAEFGIPDQFPARIAAPRAVRSAEPEIPVSILICTHRRPAGLSRLLKALVPQVSARPSREIIVVNDGTHDEAYAKVAAEYTKTIRYRALETNVGVAAARNAAASLAAGDYLVFTDDDCEPPPHWLNWLCARLAANPELDVLAGTTKPLLPEAPTFFERVRAVHDLIPTTARADDGTIIFPTANVAIRRSLFESLGGFGFPEFHGAGEDTELATRIAIRGTPAAYDPAWFTRHEVSEGFFALRRRYWRYGFANGRLIQLTTSPTAHDYMHDNWRAGWRTVWAWEYKGHLKRARGAYDAALAARLSATLACLVKMAYWRGVKDALTPSKSPKPA